jgi:transcription antitermination factor NusA-like protein
MNNRKNMENAVMQPKLIISASELNKNINVIMYSARSVKYVKYAMYLLNGRAMVYL